MIIRHSFVLFFLFTSTFSVSQNVSRHLFSSGGTQMVGEEIQLSISTGQAGMVGTLIENEFVLNIGFQQVEVSTSTGVENMSESNQIIVFPNPFSEQIVIEIISDNVRKVEYRLYNNLGRLMLSSPLSVNQDNVLNYVDTRSILPGIYHLVIYLHSKNNQFQVYNTSLISI